MEVKPMQKSSFVGLFFLLIFMFLFFLFLAVLLSAVVIVVGTNRWSCGGGCWLLSIGDGYETWGKRGRKGKGIN